MCPKREKKNLSVNGVFIALRTKYQRKNQREKRLIVKPFASARKFRIQSPLISTYYHAQLAMDAHGKQHRQ